MSSSAQVLLEKIAALPPEQRNQIEDFIDFLSARAGRKAAFERLLAIAPALEAAGVAAPGEDEIMAEVKAVRAARRERPG